MPKNHDRRISIELTHKDGFLSVKNARNLAGIKEPQALADVTVAFSAAANNNSAPSSLKAKGTIIRINGCKALNTDIRLKNIPEEDARKIANIFPQSFGRDWVTVNGTSVKTVHDGQARQAYQFRFCRA